MRRFFLWAAGIYVVLGLYVAVFQLGIPYAYNTLWILVLLWPALLITG